MRVSGRLAWMLLLLLVVVLEVSHRAVGSGQANRRLVRTKPPVTSSGGSGVAGGGGTQDASVVAVAPAGGIGASAADKPPKFISLYGHPLSPPALPEDMQQKFISHYVHKFNPPASAADKLEEFTEDINAVGSAGTEGKTGGVGEGASGIHGNNQPVVKPGAKEGGGSSSAPHIKYESRLPIIHIGGSSIVPGSVGNEYVWIGSQVKGEYKVDGDASGGNDDMQSGPGEGGSGS
eukprot:GHVS01078521.1.p1 GENE.GHVS01078521.1~~GHVS01078521.1.p1  ORF type:complete len:234 (-),score=36.12 GHVS01078521.1:198-899(-)